MHTHTLLLMVTFIILSWNQCHSRDPAAVPSSWPGSQSALRNGPVPATRLAQRDPLVASELSPRLVPVPTGPVIIRHSPLTVRQYSLIHVEAPEQREIKPFDIITIIVDEKSEVLMNSRFNRQKNSRLKAELKEFMRIGENGNLAPAALNGPTIDTQVQGNLNTSGILADQEGIRYRIAATVSDVLPNGTLRLEARKIIQTQDDESEYTLTGELRFEDVNADNTASSENIANLRIVKKQKGRVYDSTKRNWGYRLYDLLSPF